MHIAKGLAEIVRMPEGEKEWVGWVSDQNGMQLAQCEATR